jgi:hypothetical protein
VAVVTVHIGGVSDQGMKKRGNTEAWNVVLMENNMDRSVGAARDKIVDTVP